MSLTRILNKEKERTNIKNWFKSHFPNPGLEKNIEIKITPSQTGSSYAGDIGTALDYLIRFNLEHLNKVKFTSKGFWVAEKALEKILKAISSSDKSKIIIGYHNDKTVDKNEFVTFLNDEFKLAQKNYKSFLESGKLTDELIHSSIYLAKLDVTYRTGIIDANINNVEKLKIEELKELFSIVPWKKFKATNICIANPSFGEGSSLVGGADADLIIDKTLIDIKSSKTLKLERSDLNQIVGYFLLSEYDKLQGNIGFDIHNIGIYFARFNYLWTMSLSDFGKQIDYKKLAEEFAKLVRNRSLNLTPDNKEAKRTKSNRANNLDKIPDDFLDF